MTNRRAKRPGIGVALEPAVVLDAVLVDVGTETGPEGTEGAYGQVIGSRLA
jgi:hypothetical protein